MRTERIVYDDGISRKFIAASVVFGIVGMLVGVIIALQLAFWPANAAPFLSFGRLRPLHTNAVIFAFVGNMLFAGVYYSTAAPGANARLASDRALQASTSGDGSSSSSQRPLTLPLGFTQGKEYAELDLAHRHRRWPWSGLSFAAQHAS